MLFKGAFPKAVQCQQGKTLILGHSDYIVGKFWSREPYKYSCNASI